MKTFPIGLVVIAVITIGLMYFFPLLILAIMGGCTVVAFLFTWYCIVTAEDVPNDLTDDESFDVFNVNRKGEKK